MKQPYCKAPYKQACRCLFKKPTISASRASTVLFLNSNSWQFLDLAQGAKSRGIREANGAIQKQARRQARLPESLVRKRRLACPSTALRLWFIRAYPSHPWLNFLGVNQLSICNSASVSENRYFRRHRSRPFSPMWIARFGLARSISNFSAKS